MSRSVASQSPAKEHKNAQRSLNSLPLREIGEGAGRRDEISVDPVLHDPARFEYHNAVGILNR